jgi:multiple sugar transport system permease protein
MSSTVASSSQDRRRRKRRRAGRALLHIVLITGGVVMAAPFLAMLIGSLLPKSALLRGAFAWRDLSLDNYVETFQIMPFGRFYVNSLVVATTTTLLQILVSALAAFAFARLRFWGREAFFITYLATLLIPSQVTLIPNFILIRILQWYDTYQALILPSAFSVFSTFLLRQYFLGMPLDLDEAARMDGANSLRIWAQIIMPLSAPVLASLVIFRFEVYWNDFLWPLVVTGSESMRTIPVGLAAFQGQYDTEWNLLLAGSVVALLPVLVIFIIGQNWFVEGITLSGLNGR